MWIRFCALRRKGRGHRDRSWRTARSACASESIRRVPAPRRERAPPPRSFLWSSRSPDERGAPTFSFVARARVEAGSRLTREHGESHRAVQLHPKIDPSRADPKAVVVVLLLGGDPPIQLQVHAGAKIGGDERIQVQRVVIFRVVIPVVERAIEVKGRSAAL